MRTVFIRQDLTYKDGPRAERVSTLTYHEVGDDTLKDGGDGFDRDDVTADLGQEVGRCSVVAALLFVAVTVKQVIWPLSIELQIYLVGIHTHLKLCLADEWKLKRLNQAKIHHMLFWLLDKMSVD